MTSPRRDLLKEIRKADQQAKNARRAAVKLASLHIHRASCSADIDGADIKKLCNGRPVNELTPDELVTLSIGVWHLSDASDRRKDQ